MRAPTRAPILPAYMVKTMFRVAVAVGTIIICVAQPYAAHQLHKIVPRNQHDIFAADWVHSGKISDFNCEQILQAVSLCEQNEVPAKSDVVRWKLLTKLSEEKMRLQQQQQTKTTDTTQSSDSTTGVAQLYLARKLIVCMMATFNGSAITRREKADFAIMMLLHHADDIKVIVAVLENGFAAGQAMHIIGAYLNDFVLGYIDFMMQVVYHTNSIESWTVAQAYNTLRLEAQQGSLDLDGYKFLVMYETLDGHSPTFRSWSRSLPHKAQESDCIAKSVIDKVYGDLLQIKLAAMIQSRRLRAPSLTTRVRCNYYGCGRSAGFTLLHQLAFQGAAQAVTLVRESFRTPMDLAHVTQALGIRDWYGNHTALDVAVLRHGTDSAVAAEITTWMNDVGLNSHHVERGLLAKSQVVVDTDMDTMALDIGRRPWVHGVEKCATFDYSQSLGGDFVEYAGLPSAAQLKMMISSGVPVVLRGAGRKLGLNSSLWNFESFLEKYGRYSVPFVRGSGGVAETTPVNQYLTKIATYPNIATADLGYVFTAVQSMRDRRFREGILEDVLPLESWLASSAPFSTLPAEGSGYFLAIGAPCSGGKLHFHGTAVNILMHGAKRWSIFRPSHVGSAYCGSPGPQFIEEQVKGTRAIDVAFVQNAMDIVIVGEQWAHATANIEAGIAVAKVYELCDCCYS